MTDRETLAAEEEATLRAALGHFQDEPNGRLIGRLLATLDRERAAGVRLGTIGLRAENMRLRQALSAIADEATSPNWDDAEEVERDRTIARSALALDPR